MLMCRVENKNLDTAHIVDNQYFMNADVEFEFALFLGRLIETSYLCDGGLYQL